MSIGSPNPSEYWKSNHKNGTALISHRFSGLVLGDAPVVSYILRGLEKRGYNFSLATSRGDASD